jgi:hypothetical protein
MHVDAEVRVLEAFDALPAEVTMREQREDVARDLLENWVVTSAREGHRQDKGSVA